jgi:hypothetical protein
LSEFLRSGRVFKPTPKISIDRIAISLEKLFEGFPRALLELEHEVFVAGHENAVVPRKLNPEKLAFL